MSLDVAAVAADSASLYAIKTPTRWIACLQATVNNTGNAKPTQSRRIGTTVSELT